MLRVIVVAAVIFVGLPMTSAGAEHDMVYAPCDPQDTRPVDEQVWFIDYQSGDMLRFDDPWWSERPGLAGYTNWEHQCRLGTTGVWQAAPILPLYHPPDYEVETRQTKPACARELDTTVDRLIAQGLLSSEHVAVTDYGVLLHLTSPVPLVETGVVMEWALGHDGFARHYTDTYWEHRFDGVSNWTFWKSTCVPIVSPPTTTTQAPTSTTTTTTTLPAPEPPANEPEAMPAPDPLPAADTPDDYDLFDAEWDGYPFEQTILLLEERYPPGTPDRFHFRLSVAVEFLRQGGMVKGLDNLWGSG